MKSIADDNLLVNIDRDKEHVAVNINELLGTPSDILTSRSSLSIKCDWDVGIGGSLWSCASLFLKYMRDERDFFQRVFDGASVLELGAGTGLLGLAIASVFKPTRMVLTDQESHLSLCNYNISRNCHLLYDECVVECSEYSWGITQRHDKSLTNNFNVVIGTDLAYFSHLYEPLIHTLSDVIGPSTVLFLGVTKSDTEPSFFSKLTDAGFRFYEITLGANTSNFSMFTVFR